MSGERVILSGSAVTFMTAEIDIDTNPLQEDA